MAGLLRPDSGTVELGGERVDDLPDGERSDLRLRRLGFVFQFGDLVPELTVVENTELPLRLTGVPRRHARERALELLESLGVDDVASRRVSEVSGGQAQRAAVARALVHNPAVGRLSRQLSRGSPDEESAGDTHDSAGCQRAKADGGATNLACGRVDTTKSSNRRAYSNMSALSRSS